MCPASWSAHLLSPVDSVHNNIARRHEGALDHKVVMLIYTHAQLYPELYNVYNNYMYIPVHAI